MTHSTSNSDALRKVLLATDLSARGDRALERAVAIATSQNAQLLLVHVFEEIDESTLTYGRRSTPSWQRPPDAATIAKQRISRGLRADLGDAVDKATVLIEDGDPAQAIERVATSEGVDLVVTGIARECLFASRPVVIGRTVEKLLRRLPIPILVVSNRPRATYRHIVVTTDFSEPSAHALQMALRFFPAQTVYLLHAFEAPYSTLVSDQQRYDGVFIDAYTADLETFLASISLSDADRRRIIGLVEPGPPQPIVREYVRVHDADLVVLGTHGRGAMLEALMGSTAKSILSSLSCDALVVRGPRK